MKQTKNYLSIAALVAVGAILAGCTKIDETAGQLQQEKNIVTLTTTISFTEPQSTKALTAAGVKTFDVGDKIAVVYENTSSTMVMTRSLSLTEGDIASGGKSATFTMTLTDPKASGSVKYIYPAAMANDDGSINYDALSTQDGTLSSLENTHDLAIYDGSLTTSATLPDSPKLANQLAILACTLTDESGFSELNGQLTSMTISDGTYSYDVSRTAAPGLVYVAIRPIASADIEVTAFDEVHSYTKTLTAKTYAAGNGYPVTWRMTMVQ